MTSSPSDTEATEEVAEEVGEEEAVEAHPLDGFARSVAEAVGGEYVITFDTVKVTVPADSWVEALRTARDDFDLVAFSFLSAIDWSNDVAVGDKLTEELDEPSFEVLATVGDLTEGKLVTFSTRLGHDEPAIDSLTGVFVGANWHEREANEMFGIDFPGHGDLGHLYLPEGFIGNPLLKSFPLLSREVKPWPGKVDVEGMPDEDEEGAGQEADAEAADAVDADAVDADAVDADAVDADAVDADAEGADAEGADAEGADAEGADAAEVPDEGVADTDEAQKGEDES